MCSNFSFNVFFRDPPDRGCLCGVYYTGFSLWIFTMVLVVSPCLSAPKSSPWWTDSCNSSPPYSLCRNFELLNLRHGRSPDEVKGQLAVLMNSLKWHKKQLLKFYTNTTREHMNPNLKLTDINLRKVLDQMKKKRKNKMVKFYVGLQMIARVLDKYVGIDIESKAVAHEHSEKRRCHLTKIVYSLKSLLCEVRDTIIEENPRGRDQIQRHSLKRLGKKTEPLNLSQIYMADIDLLNKMKWFLKASKKVLFRSKNRRTSKY